MPTDQSTPFGFCHCGCGGVAPLIQRSAPSRGYVKGQPHRFIMGHNGRHLTGKTYRLVYDRQTKTESYAHRVICDRVMGRGLPLSVQVHHVDGNKRNNAHRNLVICQDAAYHRLLHQRAAIVRAGGNPNTELYCGSCERVKPIEAFAVSRANKGSGRCSRCRECSAQYWQVFAARRRLAGAA